jgi:hypothetical protein
MKRIVIKCFFSLGILLLSLTVTWTAFGDYDACLDKCNDNLNSCLSYTSATDPEHQEARIQECYDRFRDCTQDCR